LESLFPKSSVKFWYKNLQILFSAQRLCTTSCKNLCYGLFKQHFEASLIISGSKLPRREDPSFNITK